MRGGGGFSFTFGDLLSTAEVSWAQASIRYLRFKGIHFLVGDLLYFFYKNCFGEFRTFTDEGLDKRF